VIIAPWRGLRMGSKSLAQIDVVSHMTMLRDLRAVFGADDEVLAKAHMGRGGQKAKERRRGARAVTEGC